MTNTTMSGNKHI